MMRVICGLAARIARLSFIAAAPPGGALLCFHQPRPAWVGGWLEGLLRASGYLKKREVLVSTSALGTSGLAKLAKAGSPRAEFRPGSFDAFRAAVMRESADWAALAERVSGAAPAR